MSNHFISLADARTMTTLYLSKKEDILDLQYKGQDILLNSDNLTVMALMCCSEGLLQKGFVSTSGWILACR